MPAEGMPVAGSRRGRRSSASGSRRIAWQGRGRWRRTRCGSRGPSCRGRSMATSITGTPFAVAVERMVSRFLAHLRRGRCRARGRCRRGSRSSRRHRRSASSRRARRRPPWCLTKRHALMTVNLAPLRGKPLPEAAGQSPCPVAGRSPGSGCRQCRKGKRFGENAALTRSVIAACTVA